MPDYKEKELAIKVAEKLGDEPIFWENCQEHGIGGMDVTFYEPYGQYLHRKAAEILFSEGMAGKIDAHLYKIGFGDGSHGTRTHNIAAVCWIRQWWATLTKVKLLNVWLELLELDK